jgi:hypothetical protein
LSSILPAVFTGIVFVVALWRLPLLHPVQLWSGSWAVSTSLYALRLLPYRDLSWLTAGLICGGVVAFAAGVPLGERIAARRQVSRPARSDVATVQLAAWLSIALLTVTLAAFLSHLIARFGVVRTLRITTEVKVYLAGAEAPASGGYVQVAVAAAALCALAAALAGTAGLRRRWLVAAIACAGTAYFSTSRGFIGVALIAGLASLGVAAMNIDRRSLVKMTIALGAVMLVLFFGLGAVIGKTYGNSTIGGFDNFFSRHQAVSSLALPYEDLTASVPSLDLLVRDSTTWGRAHGCATAPIACGVVRKLGVPAVRVPVTAPFTSAPLQWNAYTFLDRFLIDGGTALTLVLVAITGVLAGYLWARARAGSTVGIIIYAIGAPALVFAYRQNLIELAFLASLLGAGLLLVARLLSRLRFARRMQTAR